MFLTDILNTVQRQRRVDMLQDNGVVDRQVLVDGKCVMRSSFQTRRPTTAVHRTAAVLGASHVLIGVNHTLWFVKAGRTWDR